MSKMSRGELEKKIAEYEAQLDTANDIVLNLTESGNGDIFAQNNKGKVLWVPEVNAWFFWNGTRWEEDKDGFTVRLYRETVVPELEKVVKDVDKEEVKDLIRWVRSSQQMGTIERSLKASSSCIGMTKSLNEFDSKGHYFGVTNGVLDLRVDNFRLVKDDSSYLMTKGAAVNYEPNAKCEEWDKFLHKITKEDEELIKFLQRIAGQSMLGLLGKDKLPMFHGTGANGKSTFVDVLNDLFGEYGAVTASRVVMSDGRNNPEYYLAPLKGLRLLLLNETKKGQRVAEEIVKMMVDSGEITARYPHGRVFSFQPVFTTVLSTNHKPRVSGADYGIWRRILLVPFSYRFSEDEKIVGFREKVLSKEMSGILNWCIEGCLEYQKQGLNPPESVLTLTEEYRRQQDKIGSFINENYIEEGEQKIRLKELHEQFTNWCLSNGLPAQGIIEFRNDLADRDYELRNSTGNVAWVYGLRERGSFDVIQGGLDAKMADNELDKTNKITELMKL